MGKGKSRGTDKRRNINKNKRQEQKESSAKSQFSDLSKLCYEYLNACCVHKPPFKERGPDPSFPTCCYRLTCVRQKIC